MKKPLAIAGVIALALFAGGCSETLKEWFKRVAPQVACQKAEREHADYLASGKVVKVDGKPLTGTALALAQKGIEALYDKTKKECAERGVIIN